MTVGWYWYKRFSQSQRSIRKSTLPYINIMEGSVFARWVIRKLLWCQTVVIKYEIQDADGSSNTLPISTEYTAWCISTWLALIPRIMSYCPACRTTFIATRFRVAVICPIIPVPHCIRVFFYFVWFVFINHIFQFYYELCTYCNILDIYLS